MQKKRMSAIHLRDPFVLADTNEKKYFLYGTLGYDIFRTMHASHSSSK
ncbi:hypothetical protein [Cohnella sp.]